MLSPDTTKNCNAPQLLAPRSELVRIIESVLLLNNYALIPGRAKDRKGD